MRASLGLIALSLCTLLFNLWIWGYAITVKRDTGYRYQPASYASLYHLNDQPHLANLARQGSGQITFEIKNWPCQQMTSQHASPSHDEAPATRQHPANRPLQLTLHKGINDLQLTCHTPTDQGTHTLSFDYAPGHTTASTHLSPLYQLVSSSLAYGPPSRFQQADFILSVPTDADQLQTLFTDTLHLAPHLSDRQKLEQIGLYLLALIQPLRGDPTDEMEQLDAYQQYQYLLAKKSKVWCNNIARIFAMLSNAAGIPTRLVHAGGQQNGIKRSNHVFVESYLASHQAWAYLDLTYNNLFIENAHGQVLNTVEVFHALSRNQLEGLHVTQVINQQLTPLPLAEQAERLRFYLSPHAQLLFSKNHPYLTQLPKPLQKILIPLTNPDQVYHFHETRNAYWQTRAAFYALIGVFGCWIYRLWRSY